MAGQSASGSDDRLVVHLVRAGQGDRKAFRALYDATAPKLFGVILRIIRDRQVAEEVLQETFVRIWQSAEKYEPTAGHPMSWLATIARNKAIDRIRSEKVSPARADDENIMERLAAPSSADPLAREALRQCLDELNVDARDCVLLAYCSGYSREELAERFGRPVGTIKTLLHRSTQILRACLGQE